MSTVERTGLDHGRVWPWVVGVLVAGIFVPGGGVVVALIGSFTSLRHASPAARWGLTVLGVVLLLVWLGTMFVQTGGGAGPGVRVGGAG